MKSLFFAAGFALLAVATALYFVSGSFAADPAVERPTPHSQLASAESRPDRNDSGLASVASLVTGLEEKLSLNPDDSKGWLLLAKSYQHLGRPDDAREAYRKAAALGHTDARVAAQLFDLTVTDQ